MAITDIRAVETIHHGGTRVTEAVLSVTGIPTKEDRNPGSYEVRQIKEDGTMVPRTVTGVRPGENEKQLVLELSPDDPGCGTFQGGNPWEGIPARVLPAKLEVNGKESDGAECPSVSRYVQGFFEDISYSLFIPEGYARGKSYPLVQFIHDASVCGSDPALAIRQGYGAASFSDPAAQAKHPCFVLCPQFDLPEIVDDDWSVDERLESAKRLLDHVVDKYGIDQRRIYTTGQSMGCMSSMVLNLRYPQLFAASFFVAGQWDENAFRGAGLEHKHFWFLNSQGDAKAFPTMNQQLVVLEKEGAKIARKVWDAGLSQEDYQRMTKDLVATDANMIYTPFRLETVADGWHSGGGEHHVDTWRFAYRIDAIHDWMFAQSL